VIIDFKSDKMKYRQYSCVVLLAVFAMIGLCQSVPVHEMTGFHVDQLEEEELDQNDDQNQDPPTDQSLDQDSVPDSDQDLNQGSVPDSDQDLNQDSVPDSDQDIDRNANDILKQQLANKVNDQLDQNVNHNNVGDPFQNDDHNLDEDEESVQSNDHTTVSNSTDLSVDQTSWESGHPRARREKRGIRRIVDRNGNVRYIVTYYGSVAPHDCESYCVISESMRGGFCGEALDDGDVDRWCPTGRICRCYY